MDEQQNDSNIDENNEGSSSRQKRVKAGCYPTKFLMFNCNRSSTEVVWEDDDHDKNIYYFQGAKETCENYNDNFKK